VLPWGARSWFDPGCMAERVEPLRARAILLDETRWANDFAWTELESIASHLAIQTRNKGDIVFNEGDVDPSLFIIASGSVSILKMDGNKETLLARLGPGQSLGEMALLDGWPRSATGIAAEDVVLLVFTRGELDRLVEQKPHLGVKLLWKLARFLSQRLRQTSGSLAAAQFPHDVSPHVSSDDE
jgi:CRP/FNR family cyclic AMP-dependent transcriptional regulator